MNAKHTPSRAQRAVLRSLDCSLSLDDGRIELSIDCGIAGAALESTIDACTRRGWIGEDGRTNDCGRAALAKVDA
jgi:hypothetical protein